MDRKPIDLATAKAARAFMARLETRYVIGQAILFGSRARNTHRPDSDADIAVILLGAHGKRATVAMDMAGIAFDVMLDTGILIEALPLWADELEHASHFQNPSLIENIGREGIRL